MQNILELSQVIDKSLAQIDWNKKPENLYQPISYIMQLPAKRLRPALALLSCKLFDGHTSHALPVALAIEMFHNFTLVHDDIMDNAPIRRGNDTVHQKWNTNIAILAGDALFAMAVNQLAQAPAHVLPQLLQLFTTTALQVCEGQQLDMDYEKTNNITIAQYLHMIELKTAVLLGTSLHMGALCADASTHDCHNIYLFGKNLGIAFQLHDDILDVYGGEKFGKIPGGDILANKKTFLLLKAMDMANIEQYDDIKALIDNRNNRFAPFEKIAKMTSIYNQLQVREHAEQQMQSYFDIAMQNLQHINLPAHHIDTLHHFAEKLMHRQV